MTVVVRAVAALAADIARRSSKIGDAVTVDQDRVLDRSDVLTLEKPGIWSPNRSCRLVRTADGWIAVNLARESDRELLPAWIGCGIDAEPWRAVVGAARGGASRALVARARLLGLPAARIGEVRAADFEPRLRRMGAGPDRRRAGPLAVIDLSSLWAGPLCGAVLARAGMAVTKVESPQRPDPTRRSTPALFERLNADKQDRVLDFADPADIAALRAMIAMADVLITSARPRAFEQLGLAPESVFADNPGLVWVAVTGYGWFGRSADRVAFGDDAAAAGGLLRWTARGEPRFVGDALADPLTGLAAAAGAIRAVRRGGGILVDAALSRTAAGAVAQFSGVGA